MAKLIQVVISSILLVALFLTLALTWDACAGKSKTKTLEEKADEAFQQFNDEDDFFESDLDPDTEDTYEEDTNGEDGSTTDYSTQDEDTEPIVDYSEIEDKVPNEETTSTSSSISATNSSGGKYLIVAGSFLVKENATEMVSKLVIMGYNSAEWSVFDYSQYYTVVALRTNDYSSAQSVSKELKNKGIDNYVHTKR